jgi:hypothetical protein
MSKHLSTSDGIIRSGKQFAEEAIDFTDKEVKEAGQVVALLVQKYSNRSNTAKNLEALRDEALTRLAEIGILAEFDPTPCFYGKPPVLEFTGHVKDHAIYKYGLDHERKRSEVIESKKRNEDYRGQKDPYK